MLEKSNLIMHELNDINPRSVGNVEIKHRKLKMVGEFYLKDADFAILIPYSQLFNLMLRHLFNS